MKNEMRLIEIMCDQKENKAYMLNSTTNTIYRHDKKFKKIRMWQVVPLGLGVNRMLTNLTLTVSTVGIAWLIILIGVLLCGAMYLVMIKKRYRPTEGEYLKLKPKPQVLNDIKDKNYTVSRVHETMIIMLLLTIGSLGVSLNSLSNFINTLAVRNLIDGMFLLSCATMLGTRLDYIFILFSLKKK